ncbi:MAG: hypothetical protein ACYSWU_12065, partial [Planctomycetota bacterium]
RQQAARRAGSFGTRPPLSTSQRGAARRHRRSRYPPPPPLITSREAARVAVYRSLIGRYGWRW